MGEEDRRAAGIRFSWILQPWEWREKEKKEEREREEESGLDIRFRIIIKR